MKIDADPVTDLAAALDPDWQYSTRARGYYIAKALYSIAAVTFFAYLALEVLDVARAGAYAALTYSKSARYSVMGVNANDRAVYVFDSATGEASKQTIEGME